VEKKKTWQILIDTGGTFTDCIAISPQGSRNIAKVLSNGTLRARITEIVDRRKLKFSGNWPAQKNIFDQYFFRALPDGKELHIQHLDMELSEITFSQSHHFRNSGFDFEVYSGEEVPIFASRILTETPLNKNLPEIEMRLGTTRGTNALLERKGAKIAFLVTEGFRDLLAIGDQRRPDLFAINILKPDPLYSQVIQVKERLNASGKILIALTEKEISRIVKQLQKFRPEAVAVCFMHSYLNPVHEEKIASYLQKSGFSYISLSSELFPAIKILPRAQTAVVDAYLSPIMTSYLKRISGKLSGSRLRVMTSAAGLSGDNLFRPKDSLLSGPAGGLVGAALKARESGFEKIITLDTGGTSTDVARYDSKLDYKYELAIGDAVLSTPALSIETIASGGGSICSYDGFRFRVGPESAGAYPGPACYGAGGPLTLTDVNLLLGKIDPSNFGIPLNLNNARKKLKNIQDKVINKTGVKYNEENILQGFLDIANEKMAEAIKKISIARGYNTKEYAMLSFGGAGGQHVCNVSDLLNISKIIVPYEAGLLSAIGIGYARVEKFLTHQVLKPYNSSIQKIDKEIAKLKTRVEKELKKEGFQRKEIIFPHIFIYLRFSGQENTLEIPFKKGSNHIKEFRSLYQAQFGHYLESREIEIESIKVIGSTISAEKKRKRRRIRIYKPKATKYLNSFCFNHWERTPLFEWESLSPGAHLAGPAIIAANNHTLFVEKSWNFQLNEFNTAIVSRGAVNKLRSAIEIKETILELFTNRFRAIADQMGALLERTSFSVNVKERLDFSCAILDKNGCLVVNAPHIPVHLGSLGVCVRSVIRQLDLQEGDVVITNHPGFGGSHLPDITLIAPVFAKNKKLLGYVANRAHHAEIGGTLPGSMPPDATCLAEEGVIFRPQKWVTGGKANWDLIHGLLTDSPYPTRAVHENIADLNGALASIQSGINGLKTLSETEGYNTVCKYMELIQEHAHEVLTKIINQVYKKPIKAKEFLDDGSPLSVSITKERKLIIDFNGTGKIHQGNMNTSPAVVNSVVIYVLRLLAGSNLPLNEGLMRSVELRIPTGLLNPEFVEDDFQNPAVVGGNTETSQRLTDTLLKAFKLAACSQGTMNNVVFGNDRFGYYETICGGTGAGNGFHGSDAVHQHMTNTKITDPEIMELRYPVYLKDFSIRKRSGGRGKWHGGNGVRREITFFAPVSLTIFSQHRIQSPYGLLGGSPGGKGNQFVIRKSGQKVALQGIQNIDLKEGDTFIVETPGGGGYGS